LLCCQLSQGFSVWFWGQVFFHTCDIPPPLSLLSIPPPESLQFHCIEQKFIEEFAGFKKFDFLKDIVTFYE
jgi:hypothetical protein